MSTAVIMPQLGETVAEGKVLTWFKSVGDEIKVGDRLFEVETDKVTVDVEAIAAGTLTEIRVGNDTTVKVGTVVAVIGGTVVAPPPIRTPAALPHRLISPFNEIATPTENFGKAIGPNGLLITPLARRFLAANSIDLSTIARHASAKGLKKLHLKDAQECLPGAQTDPAKHFASTAILPTPADSATGEVVELNKVRLKTGERLAESWRDIPHVFQAIEVDFSHVDTIRGQQKERFRAETGLSLTSLPFIARATCLALRAFPHVNARLSGSSLLLSTDINLGIAVDLSFNGLVVPVVRNAGDLTLPGLARAIGRQIDKTRAGKLTADDFSGATYTITNNGAFGTSFTAPIINSPQVAILSTDAIRKRPAVVSTPQGDFIAPRLIGFVGQSFDHRAFDGAYSAAYLSKLKEILETRNWGEEFPSGK